jgi:hypothetical protein
MPYAHIRSLTLIALALVTFSGRLVDATTGQPMPKVAITVTGPSRAAAKTDARGRFTLKGLKPGAYTLQAQSDDVPAQAFHVTMKPGSTTVMTMKVCSMTLDYHCGTPDGGGGGA